MNFACLSTYSAKIYGTERILVHGSLNQVLVV